MIGYASNTSSNVVPINQKAAEAELIARATKTAIVAARSILMAGGNEEVALKTAKAAAESVLNPMGSDNDTVSGRSTLGGAFGGKKRKAKRQAEVVASMALMSATSAIPTANGIDMGEYDSFNGNPYGRNIINIRDEPSVFSGSNNNPYGRNITTIRQDEPSVLSGSISRIPNPKSNKSNKSNASYVSSPSPQAYTINGGTLITNDNHSSTLPQQQQQQQQQVLSPMQRAILPPTYRNSNEKMAKQDGVKNVHNNILLQIESDSVSQSSTMDSDQQSSVETSLGEGQTMTDTTDAESMNADVRDREEQEQDGGKNDKEMKASWGIVDTLMAMNIFNCGQITTGDVAVDFEELENLEKDNTKGKNNESSGRRSRRDKNSSPIVESRDDTFDDQTTSYSHDDGRNTERDYRDPHFGALESSYSETSSGSAPSSLSEASEGDIQVRSSIRETMESIVSNSKNSYRQSKNNEMGWLSYEMRKKDDDSKKSNIGGSSRRSSSRLPASPRISKQQTSNNSTRDAPSPSKSTKSARRRTGSLFNKSKGRR